MAQRIEVIKSSEFVRKVRLGGKDHLRKVTVVVKRK